MEKKKLVISLVALAALSGAAYASDYGNNKSGDGTYVRKSADSSGLVIIKKGKKKLTAFERMNLTAEHNAHSDRHGNDHGPKE